MICRNYQCIACKDLRASTEYFLYQVISWNFQKILPLRRLLRLLRTILDRSVLTSSIQLLSLPSSKSKWITPEHGMNWSEELLGFKGVTEKAIYIIRQAEFPDAYEWTDALWRSNFFAFAAVLISQLANIKSLRLDFCFVWLSGFPGRMIKHALFSPNKGLSPFDFLQEVGYGENVPNPVKYWTEIDDGPPDRLSDPYDQSQFIGWFYLPSLRYLEIWLRDIEELKTKPDLNLSHLHTLILAQSTIPEKDVPSYSTEPEVWKTFSILDPHAMTHKLFLGMRPVHKTIGCGKQSLLNVKLGLIVIFALFSLPLQGWWLGEV